jgi:hypothetical protein
LGGDGPGFTAKVCCRQLGVTRCTARTAPPRSLRPSLGRRLGVTVAGPCVGDHKMAARALGLSLVGVQPQQCLMRLLAIKYI